MIADQIILPEISRGAGPARLVEGYCVAAENAPPPPSTVPFPSKCRGGCR